MGVEVRAVRPRLRVISDNDYAGDPDGLFQLAHAVLSPSAELRGVIGSHLRPGDSHDPSDRTATHARAEAERVVELLGRGGSFPIVEGSNVGLSHATSPIRSPGAELIVKEAMRESDLPLFVTLGGGLTELASAYLLEPGIAGALTAVWIGGPEYLGVAPAPRAPEQAASEYNTRIDIQAAQVVFDSPIPLWQVPRDVYRQAIISLAELEARVRPLGRIGRHLMASLDRVIDMNVAGGRDLGETYVLGDNPLVLLTALQSAFEPDTSSSVHANLPAPAIDGHGQYVARSQGRPIRVYTRIDTRLMFEDMMAKLARMA